MRLSRDLLGASRVLAVVAAAAFVCTPEPTHAQTGQFEKVDNPYQEDLDYTVNTDLRPGIEVDGVRWIRFAVRTKEGEEIVANEITPVTVELDLLNTGGGAKVLVIVLFEDENGNPLGRIECGRVNPGKGRLRESVQKFSIDGSTLLATQKVYLLFEVLR